MEINEKAKELAAELLRIGAVKLSPQAPFTWASGWKSPIYCDNRQTLSYPELRGQIRDYFVQIITKHYPHAEVIAGVATGGIAIGALVAEALELPFVYVRAKQKTHGMGNQIEGALKPQSRTVVIEDLVSTGKSSLQAVEALREARAEVLGMVAIFSYEFDVAYRHMEAAKCPFISLSGYQALLEVAQKEAYIDSRQIQTLQAWRRNPGGWEKPGQ